MFTYPLLTPAEQASLPTLVAEPNPIQAKFEDSTHQLFYCQTTDGEMVLKVCHEATIRSSHFWLGANHLFAANFPDSLGDIHLTHHFLQKNGALTVPGFVAANAQRFVLTRFLAGKDLDAELIADDWVIQLAEHIVKLHQCTYTSWGQLHAPKLPAIEWSGRLHQTITFLAKQKGTLIDKTLLAEVLANAENIRETQFVPMMLDLRWDQFRSGTNDLALIDLDAFFIAPRALDLVLLEYVLTPTQLALFKQHYIQIHNWPEHGAYKSCYQLLLFLMNILGETDLAKWMQQI